VAVGARVGALTDPCAGAVAVGAVATGGTEGALTPVGAIVDGGSGVVGGSAGALVAGAGVVAGWVVAGWVVGGGDVIEPASDFVR
jgi:hypothetical protein